MVLIDDCDIWLDNHGLIQEFSSANTSINAKKLPRIFREVEWKSGTRNADIGGGKYNNGTEFLKTLGVENFIYDPFNRNFMWNIFSLSKIRDGQCDTCTVCNTLNVIKEPENRYLVIRQAHNVLKNGGVAYFTIYEGDKKGIGINTKNRCWQENREAESYSQEILSEFAFSNIKIKRSKKLIIAYKEN